MNLQKNIYPIRCELGACCKTAEYSIKFDNLGFEHNVHVCNDCLIEMHKLISKDLLSKDSQEPKPTKFKTAQKSLTTTVKI